MKQERIQKYCVIALFLAYFIIGFLVFDDYGISTDEPDERQSTFTNIKYTLDTIGIETLDGADGDLENYIYKYYGIAMQIPPAMAEWALGFPDGADMWLLRHFWTFLVCFCSYVCFYCMCHEIFGSRGLGLLGTAMIALYPRFFAEQFYNIKDMMFTAMVIISMFVTIRLIQSKYAIGWTVLFAIVSAFATNVRIVGAIFPILLLAYLWLLIFLKKFRIETGEYDKHIFRTSILIISIYLVTYIVLMPILWKNPIREIIAVFNRFSDYDVWNGSIVFMGKIISGKEIPWYYIPVWLLISLPIWYLVLFVLVIGVLGFLLIKGVKKDKKLKVSILLKNKYMIWASLIGFLPWITTVIMGSTLYNGWRHCYFILPPMVFVIIGGIAYIWKRFNAIKILKMNILFVVALGLTLQCVWIVKNHPHEMVYLNLAARSNGDDFDRDYWNVSLVELNQYILENDDNPQITIDTPNSIFMRFLSKEDRERIVLEDDNPMYIIDTYRGKTGNDNVMNGYEDWYSIEVDGYRIATVYKRKS